MRWKSKPRYDAYFSIEFGKMLRMLVVRTARIVNFRRLDNYSRNFERNSLENMFSSSHIYFTQCNLKNKTSFKKNCLWNHFFKSRTLKNNITVRMSNGHDGLMKTWSFLTLPTTFNTSIQFPEEQNLWNPQ